MSGVLSTSKWLRFFSDAGLPPSVSANYAVLFTDNRITTDMLLDLTKEYLYDMGIKVMGDVIAILRYARTAYTKEAQEKILQENPIGVPKSTPASRMLKHYSRQRTPTGIELKRKESFETPMKKFARVSAEQSKAVRGQCDSSEKPSTQAQYQQAAKGYSGKRSVFYRLGENSVSSSTDLEKTKPQGHSVFNRLGGSSPGGAQAASSTVNEDDDEEVPKRIYKTAGALQYRGVLKTTPARSIVTFSTSTPLAESSNDIRDWLKPSLLRKRVPRVQTSTISKRVINIGSSSDPAMLFKRSLREAGSQGRLTAAPLHKGSRNRVFATHNVKARLGMQEEKTLTVRLPKSLTIPSRAQRFASNKIVFNKTMISDKNSEMQRKTRLALTKNASNRVIYLNKSQAKSNVFSRLGS